MQIIAQMKVDKVQPDLQQNFEEWQYTAGMEITI